jgi:hypothetical protein
MSMGYDCGESFWDEAREVAHRLGEVLDAFEDAFEDEPPTPVGVRCNAVVTITNAQGAPMADFTLPVTSTATLHVDYTWFDAHGNPIDMSPVPASPNAIYAVSDPSVASVDPSAGTVTPLGPIAAGLAGTVTNPDGSPLSDPAGIVTFTVVPVLFDTVAGPPAAATATLSIA